MFLGPRESEYQEAWRYQRDRSIYAFLIALISLGFIVINIVFFPRVEDGTMTSIMALNLVIGVLAGISHFNEMRRLRSKSPAKS